MVKVFSGYGVKEDSRCPGCGTILTSYNKDGVCGTCFDGFNDFSKKVNPKVAEGLRQSNPNLYFGIMHLRARLISEQSGI